jgi:hypothetical protein
MRKLSKTSTVLAAICAASAVLVMAPESQAGVMNVVDKAVIKPASSIEQIHYRRYYHRHYYRHYGHYRHYRYHYGYYPYYNPAGAVAGAAVGLATAPLWALTGYPYYGYPSYGWW